MEKNCYQSQKIASPIKVCVFTAVCSCTYLNLGLYSVARTKSMKKPTPVKNEKDRDFIKISYLNQENKNTYFNYKQLPQIELHMFQVLNLFG